MWHEVKGSSMYPLIKAGYKVLAKPISAVIACDVGDIVLVRHKEELICHRIIYCKAQTIYLRGDASSHIEGPLHISQLQGKVTAFFDGSRIHLMESVSQQAYAYAQAFVGTQLMRLPGARVASKLLKTAASLENRARYLQKSMKEQNPELFSFNADINDNTKQ